MRPEDAARLRAVPRVAAKAEQDRGGVGSLSRDDLEAVVDAVVGRIEDRVVDELERRGRRDGWGAY